MQGLPKDIAVHAVAFLESFSPQFDSRLVPKNFAYLALSINCEDLAGMRILLQHGATRIDVVFHI